MVETNWNDDADGDGNGLWNKYQDLTEHFPLAFLHTLHVPPKVSLRKVKSDLISESQVGCPRSHCCWTTGLGFDRDLRGQCPPSCPQHSPLSRESVFQCHSSKASILWRSDLTSRDSFKPVSVLLMCLQWPVTTSSFSGIRCSRLTLQFLAPGPESALFPRSPGSFWWGMGFRNQDLDIMCALYYRGIIAFGPFQYRAKINK